MNNLIFLLLWMNSSLALAQAKAQKPLNEVESILDQLEKRLQENEVKTSAPMSFGSKKYLKSDEGLVKFKQEKIEADLNESQKLISLSEAISKLEDDINKIDSEVHLARQSLLETAKIDNVVEIEGLIGNPDKIALRSLLVHIDGYEVYTLNDSNGLWIPSKSIPLYSGPMSPGKHRVTIDARISSKSSDHFPFINGDYQVVSRSFEIDIPDGVFKKRWSIDLAKNSTKNYPKAQGESTDQGSSDKKVSQ